MDITRTPIFSKAASPLGCGCDVKTEIEGQGTYVPWPSVFYMLASYWNSVLNHNGQIIASNASVNTHSLFLLAGYYAPNSTEHRIYSTAARSVNACEGDTEKLPLFGGRKESLYPDYLNSYRGTA